MVKPKSLLNRIGKPKVLLAGDFFLDSYTLGKIDRISPEAPVPILNVTKEESRPGGAGNVALNLTALRAEVVVVGRIGKDSAGQHILSVLSQAGVDVDMLLREDAYTTPIKNRIIADSQQIVRIDHENIVNIAEELEQEVIRKIPGQLNLIDVVAISDYGKGFLTPAILNTLIQEAKKRKIPVITDPKGINFSKYKESTIIKPNLAEAYAAASMPRNAPLELVAEKILRTTQADSLIITKAGEGISLFTQNGSLHFPVKELEVKDVTGAGDTVLAMLSVAVGSKLTLSEAILLANVAGGISVQRFGCTQVNLSDIAIDLLLEDENSKVIDFEHLFILQDYLQNRPYKVVSFSHVTKFSFSLLKDLQQQKENYSHLIAYCPNNSELLDGLKTLHTIDFIIHQEESFEKLCSSRESEKCEILSY